MAKRPLDSGDLTEGWFTNKVKTLTAALLAVGALIAAGKPILEFLEPLVCGTLRLCGSAAELAWTGTLRARR